MLFLNQKRLQKATHQVRPDRSSALRSRAWPCCHWRYSASQINERPGRAAHQNDIATCARLLAADSGAAHFSQAGFRLMRIALFLARQFAVAPVSLLRGYLHWFSWFGLVGGGDDPLY